MRCLARREYSRAELRARLLPHQQEGEDVEAVLDELACRNWLSDARAAEQLVSQRRGRYGVHRIVHDLRRKGVAEELIAASLPELQESEFEAARAVWLKKFGVAPQTPQEKAKQVRFLQSRGFGLDVVVNLLKLPDLPE